MTNQNRWEQSRRFFYGSVAGAGTPALLWSIFNLNNH